MRPHPSLVFAALVSLSAPAVFAEQTDPLHLILAQNTVSTEDFHLAVQMNNVELVKQYLTTGGNPNVRTSEGVSPLHDAARYGHHEIAKTLAVHPKTNKNATAQGGWTALHFAANADEATICQALIDAKVDVNARTDYQYTPLHIAAREGNSKVVELLVAAGADVNAQIDAGFTAIDLADEYPSTQDYLRAKGGKSIADIKKKK